MRTVEPTDVAGHALDHRGSVVAGRDGTCLRFERRMPFLLADVWSAVTAPSPLARWFGQVSGDPASGWVELLMTAEEGAEPDAVRIHECTPPHRLRITVTSEDGDWPLDLTLAAADGSTDLVLVHHLREASDASCLGPGWQLYLDRLEAVLAAQPVPDDFDRYYPALADAYRAPGSQGR